MVWGSLECCFGAADFECIADKGSPPPFPPIFDFAIEFWSYIVCFPEHFLVSAGEAGQISNPLGKTTASRSRQAIEKAQSVMLRQDSDFICRGWSFKVWARGGSGTPHNKMLLGC